MQSISSRLVLAAAVAVCLGTASCTSSAVHRFHSLKTQAIYWDEFTGTPKPQIEFVHRPLLTTSTPTDIAGSAANNLDEANAMAIDSSNRLWIANFPPGGGAETVEVYNLPLTVTSSPVLTFTLTGVGDVSTIEFDSSGNLWGADFNLNKVYEYTGSFATSGALSPTLTLTSGISVAAGLAFDPSGNLYVANASSTGANSIAVFTTPITNTASYFLDGVNGPGGLIFDSQGNLYVFNSTAAGPGSLDRFNSNNLGSGATPNTADPSGLSGAPYGAAFALDKDGNLYMADCGNEAGIKEYPAVATSFAATEAPSVVFSDGAITTTGCVWGIAIH
jgi:hypothetical protein